MKKTIKLTLFTSMILATTSAFATNGTNLIGYGAKSRAMGGTGISNFNGAESAFANPALIAKSKSNTEITIGATLLIPEVSFEALPYGVAESKSTAGEGMIPSVAVINKVNDSLHLGMTLYGVGGMGVDYRDETHPMMSGINDNLMLMRMSIPIAYKLSSCVTVAVAPVIEYGALAMTSGATTDIATGFEVGATYQLADLALGLDYKSAVTHDFKNTFLSTNPTTGATQSKLDTPSVVGLAASYAKGRHTFAVDYKLIAYSKALGFEDFEWEDQKVFAVGYQYATNGWALRIGANKADSPLPNETVTNALTSTTLGSLMQFPAITEMHYTLGCTFKISKTASVDLAYMIATGEVVTDLAANSGGAGTPVGTATTTNNQTALSFALNYAF